MLNHAVSSFYEWNFAALLINGENNSWSEDTHADLFRSSRLQRFAEKAILLRNNKHNLMNTVYGNYPGSAAFPTDNSSAKDGVSSFRRPKRTLRLLILHRPITLFDRKAKKMTVEGYEKCIYAITVTTCITYSSETPLTIFDRGVKAAYLTKILSDPSCDSKDIFREMSFLTLFSLSAFRVAILRSYPSHLAAED